MLRFSIREQLQQRILILDGGLGTLIQRYGLSEAAYRGERFKEWPLPLQGCNDLLSLTQPEVITEIHEAYLQAGAEIISTNSFNTNAISLEDQLLDRYTYDIARAAAELARAAADRFTLMNPSKPRFVAGSMGPTNRSGSLSPDVNNPAARSVTFEELRAVYYEAARGLVDGGVDVILIETAFDTLNIKAAIFAVEQLSSERGKVIPIMVSGTLTDVSGRTLAGQTVEALCTAVHHGHVLSVGLNCGLGAEKMQPYIERLSAVAPCAVSAHPNAGLPDSQGGYRETPQRMAAAIQPYLEKGLLNIVGGCCGTTPVHIAEIARLTAHYTPRTIPNPHPGLSLCGLETWHLQNESEPLNLSRACDASRSKKFRELLQTKKYEPCANVLRAEAENGAPLLLLAPDDALCKGSETVRNILYVAMSTPEIATKSLWIRSWQWETLCAAMECLQGKPLVGPLNLAVGEKVFLQRAAIAARYGAALSVTLCDEQGLPLTLSDAHRIALRSCELLQQSGLLLRDVVIELPVMPVEGLPAENLPELARILQDAFPEITLYGELNALSAPYQENVVVCATLNSLLRESLRRVGVKWLEVDEMMLSPLELLPPETVAICRRAMHAERTAADCDALRQHAFPKNNVAAGFSAIDNPKSTSLPSQADSVIQVATLCDERFDPQQGVMEKVLMGAGYQIKKRGVVQKPVSTKAEQFLSLLICHSVQGVELAAQSLREATQAGCTTPFIVTGESLSALVVAVRLSPLYPSGVVIYAKDTSDITQILTSLRENRDGFLLDQLSRQIVLRESYAESNSSNPYRTLSQARIHKFQGDFSSITPPLCCQRRLFIDFDLEQLSTRINWSYFFGLAALPGRFPELLDDPNSGAKAQALYRESQALLREMIDNKRLQAHGVVQLYPAQSMQDEIVLYADTGYTEPLARLPQLRNQQRSQNVNFSLSDFVAPQSSQQPDSIALYAVSVGTGMEAWCESLRQGGKVQEAKLVQRLADRLCDAFVETLQHYVLTELRGVKSSERTSCSNPSQGISPSIGLPACPDHSYRKTLLELLKAEEAGITLHENFEFTTPATLCGMIFPLAEARNFTVEKIDAEQAAEYAAKRGISLDALQELIPQYLQKKIP